MLAPEAAEDAIRYTTAAYTPATTRGITTPTSPVRRNRRPVGDKTTTSVTSNTTAAQNPTMTRVPSATTGSMRWSVPPASDMSGSSPQIAKGGVAASRQ